jgi:hypothetical protein
MEGARFSASLVRPHGKSNDVVHEQFCRMHTKANRIQYYCQDGSFAVNDDDSQRIVLRRFELRCLIPPHNCFTVRTDMIPHRVHLGRDTSLLVA